MSMNTTTLPRFTASATVESSILQGYKPRTFVSTKARDASALESANNAEMCSSE